MQLSRGRHFSQSDTDNAQPVAIVNETFARQFFNNAAPIGRRVGLGAPATTMMEIVGVVGDAKYGDLRESARPMLYVPFTRYPTGLNELQVPDGRRPGKCGSADQARARERRPASRRRQRHGDRNQVDASLIVNAHRKTLEPVRIVGAAVVGRRTLWRCGLHVGASDD